jgi:hypothetical protein
MRIMSGQRWDDHEFDEQLLEQAKSFLAKTPAEVGDGPTQEIEDFKYTFNDICSGEYKIFKQYDSVHALVASSGKWAEVSGGSFLKQLLELDIVKLSNRDLSLFDLYNAFNDAMSSVGDFGSYKAIARAVLMLGKHVWNKVNSESCFTTSAILDELDRAMIDIEGPRGQLELFKSENFKNLVVSFFEVRWIQIAFYYQNFRPMSFLELDVRAMDYWKS